MGTSRAACSRRWRWRAPPDRAGPAPAGRADDRSTHARNRSARSSSKRCGPTRPTVLCSMTWPRPRRGRPRRIPRRRKPLCLEPARAQAAIRAETLEEAFLRPRAAAFRERRMKAGWSDESRTPGRAGRLGGSSSAHLLVNATSVDMRSSSGRRKHAHDRLLAKASRGGRKIDVSRSRRSCSRRGHTGLPGDHLSRSARYRRLGALGGHDRNTRSWAALAAGDLFEWAPSDTSTDRAACCWFGVVAGSSPATCEGHYVRARAAVVASISFVGIG